LEFHRVWKDAMMDWLAPRAGQRLLDVAGGTGDISFKFLGRAGSGHATVLDITESMLVEGRQRAEANDMATQLDWAVGDAMALPFKDNTFDVYTISFGIRNVTRPQEALNEAYRVLKPGGRLMVLEFSQLPNPVMQKAYDLYSFNVIPRMGKLIANDADSYQYLVESIRQFPDQETFLSMVKAAGFENASYRNLSLGIAASALWVEDLKCAGPHNIIRLIRMGATLERTGGMNVVLDAFQAPASLRIVAKLLGWPFKWLGLKGDPEMPSAVRALVALGPAYIKFGQVLSTRPDVVGDELAIQLRVLQDKLPPFSIEQAKAMVRTELERPVEEVFSTFSEPVAAGFYRSSAQSAFGRNRRSRCGQSSPPGH
jgi:demethylmenaquinone methyltransferase/2-methoxy-6-polyprenyl-1,4-benzoquinol methylase